MKEALKLALEALEIVLDDDECRAMTHSFTREAIASIKEALAQPEQEMVSYERFMGVEKELADMTAEFMRVAKQVAQPEQEPVAIEYWLQDTIESGRWVTTDNMAKATAEKMLSGEYGNVYPQGRIVEPPPPQRTWVGLTDEALDDVYFCAEGGATPLETWREQARTIEAKLKEKNT